MKIEIVYDSQTGTTAAASDAMRKRIEELGHQCRVQSITQANPAEISQADLICIGTWVKGLFIVLQHPTDSTMHFIEQLNDLTGKKAVVFCTYKLAPGSTLYQMEKALERKGANIVGRFKYRSSEPGSAFEAFVQTLG